MSLWGGNKKSQQKANPDFDEEARKLWAQLNLDPDSHNHGKWNALDPVWRHPETNGTIFVGNQTAAQDLNILKQHNITHVVNCTIGASQIQNYHEKSGHIKYYRFPISHWSLHVDNTEKSVVEFTRELFDFIDAAVNNGSSVMVHCLAGAHRGGTTGIACLIRYANLDVDTAIVAAKRCRPIIDPIGTLPDFLHLLHRAHRSLKLMQQEENKAQEDSA